MSSVVTVNSLGETLPTATRMLIDCEVKTCMEYTEGYYTTCAKHTKLLTLMGEQVRYTPHPVYVYNTFELPEGDTVFDFRFSASYASRYNNCHGSANLEEAIPGFVHPERNENGMKGEGTKLHKIFEVALQKPERLRDSAVLLKEVAALWGPRRTEYLQQDEKQYLIKWFMAHKTPPPLELSTLAEGLLSTKPVINPDKTPKMEDGQQVVAVTGGTPRRIEHLAFALEYVADVWDTLDPDSREIFAEVKREAEWLETKPKTTVDLIMRDKNIMHVMDLKMGDIVVSPINNEQLMYYAETFNEDSKWTKIRLHIIQRKGTDFWDVPLPVMTAWVKRVMASEQAILAGDLTLSPGSHCNFCPANPHGRGDRGNKACPAMMVVLYGERDNKQADEDIVGEGDDF